MTFRLRVKKYLPRTLFGRSLLILVVPVLLIQLVTAYVFFDRHWGRMTSRLAYAVSGEIAMIVDAVQNEADGREIAALMRNAERYLHLVGRFEEGGSLPPSHHVSAVQVWKNTMAESLEAELAAQIDEPFVIDFDFSRKEITVYVQVARGVIVIGLPERRLFSSSGYIFLLWVAGASGLLLFVSVLFMRNQIRPIRKLAVAAERFGKGQDVPSFKPEGAHEVRQAAQAFIDMRRRIQRQVAQRTDMLAGVSHDLRTPLTRLKLALAMMRDAPDVEAMKQDVHEMERMISGYLDFVRGAGEEQFEFIEVQALLEKMAGGLGRQNVSVSLDVQAGLRVRVRPLAFERALGNLLSNAARYGDHIWVRALEVDERKLQIQIEDNGPGIPEDMREEVFKPFKRVDSSRNSETGGVGLGLSIAMDIIQSHGGNITLGTSEHGGLCATIRMPL